MLDGTEISVGTLGDIVDSVLSTHHEPTRRWIARGKGILAELAKDHLEDEFVGKLGMAFQSLAMTMNMHLEKEEEVLFPMFRRLDEGFNTRKFCGSILNPIRVMENEHKELDAHFERIHRLTSHLTRGACESAKLKEFYSVLADLEADLKVHSEFEECELFPRAVAREEEYGSSR